jgi:hypothetical protein
VSIDSTVIDLSLSMYDWAKYKLIRCSTRESTTRRASDRISSACGMLPK